MKSKINPVADLTSYSRRDCHFQRLHPNPLFFIYSGFILTFRSLIFLIFFIATFLGLFFATLESDTFDDFIFRHYCYDNDL